MSTWKKFTGRALFHEKHTSNFERFQELNFSIFFSNRILTIKKLQQQVTECVSGVLSTQSDRGFYHYRTAVSVQVKSKVGLTLSKTVSLRITLILDGPPIISRTHTHPSHSQTSRLLTSSLSLGVPVPRVTQCMRDA
jgi:hypothetical protein